MQVALAMTICFQHLPKNNKPKPCGRGLTHLGHGQVGETTSVEFGLKSAKEFRHFPACGFPCLSAYSASKLPSDAALSCTVNIQKGKGVVKENL